MRFERLLSLADRLHPAGPAHAHCDIPCGIYVAEPAETAAETVLKMLEKLNDGSPSVHDIARFTATKEEHAERVKREILILWTDYFKSEHLEKFPDLHTKVWNACKAAGAAKKTTDVEAGKIVRDAVAEVTDIFRASKAG